MKREKTEKNMCDICSNQRFRRAIMEIENHMGIAEKEESNEQQKNVMCHTKEERKEISI